MSCLEKSGFWIGIVSAVFYGLMTCVGLAGCIYAFIILVTRANFDEIVTIISCSSLVALYVGVVSFFFSVLLVVGIKKRRPKLVLAYFIHGAVVTIVLFAVTIGFWAYLRGEFAEYCAIPTIVFVYKSITLAMIFKTHRNLQDGTSHCRKRDERLYPNMNNQYLFIDRI